MSRKTFMRQYAPLTTPSHWDNEERRFARQLCDALDDIYKRYGRLGLSDLNSVFRGTVNGLESDVASNQQSVTTLGEALSLLSSSKLDKAALPDAVYPVGSIYLSVNSTSPATLFGGTWERLGGRFLLGADDTCPAGSTGGEAEHTLTVQEMPSHKHALLVRGKTTGASTEALESTAYSATEEASDAGETDAILSAAGGSQPHNNLPPYLAVYIWKRTA